MRVAGVMSGTSVDGVDVAIVDIEGPRIHAVTFRSKPYSASMRRAILEVSDTTTTTGSISRLGFRLGEVYAKAVIETCRRAQVPLDRHAFDLCRRDVRRGAHRREDGGGFAAR